MRVRFILLFGILLCITGSGIAATSTKSSPEKPESKPIAKTQTKDEDTLKAKTVAKDSKTTNVKIPKAIKEPETKHLPGENRGKRNLFDFGNAGYLYSSVANRRAGYVNEGAPYYPQTGFYNGQNAIAQFPYNPYGPYPQYLEAPEPIIEIIIKDSNETLPEELPQPIVTKKKKKEKVHVFYVNYKKDKDNKLHLESPIASLNNDDTDEEEEEIVEIPSAVTQPPPLKTTTLRTIIHPDSEKYHSNSGIHVTFGGEDKSHLGQILEEHDAESIQRQIVAFPVGPNTRADFGGNIQGRNPSNNAHLQQPYYHVHQNNYYQAQQQLPVPQLNTVFRPNPNSNPNLYQSNTPPKFYQKAPVNHQAQPQSQPQPPQQRPPTHFLPTIQPPQQSVLQNVFNKIVGQSNYYVNHNQHYQQQSQHSQQQHHPQHHAYSSQQFNQYYHNPPSSSSTSSSPSSNSVALQKPQSQSSKPTVFFPTPPSKTQDLPTRYSPAPYQPIKFRPTTAAIVTTKAPNYQQNSFQTLQQQHHQYYQQQHQQKPVVAPKPQTQQQLPVVQHTYQFNRQPQFIQKPLFTVPSPSLPSHSIFYKPQQQSQSLQQSQNNNQVVTQQKYQSHNQVQSTFSNQNQNQNQNQALYPKPTSSTHNSNINPSTGLNAIHNIFDIKPSKETELLKAIPKFEQHITETIHHETSHQQNIYSPSATVSNQNQVIHDIPAPNLGPTNKPYLQQSNQQPSSQSAYQQSLSQSQHQQQSYQQQNQQSSLNGHYIIASSPQNQQPTQYQSSQQSYNNFVTSNQDHLASTTSPQFESNNGQKIMIVTPMPATTYNQYHSSNYKGQGNSYQPTNSGLDTQASNNYGIEPRKPGSSSSSAHDASEFSVSTYHSDVFRELEQRKQSPKSNRDRTQISFSQTKPESSTAAPAITAVSPTTPQNQKASQTLLQLPDEVPEDLRKQLLSSGILNNADISVLDYDKVGETALENLPPEHLQHFYGAGGGAQISESNRVVSVVKTNGDKVALNEKEIEKVKDTNSLPFKQNLELKVVHFNADNQKSVTDEYLKADATVVTPVDLADTQYNRYLPLKINGAQFPIPDSDELKGKAVVSVVVLAPVESFSQKKPGREGRSGKAEAHVDTKEVKFLGGDLIKTLVKKPTKENFKKWLDKEAHNEVDQQSVVLLVAKASDEAEQEIFMYDIITGAVNKLNGVLSSTFVHVAEENATSEDFEHASTLDPSTLDSMMMSKTRRK